MLSAISDLRSPQVRAVERSIAPFDFIARWPIC
jgi:hypothetical protein